MISIDKMAKAVGTVRYIAWWNQEFDGNYCSKGHGRQELTGLLIKLDLSWMVGATFAICDTHCSIL